MTTVKRSTFRLLFYIKRGEPKKNGQCPVMGRITIDGKAVQFSCKFDIDPKCWDGDAGRACGRSDQAQEANRMLDRIGAGMSAHYNELLRRDGYVNAEKVKNAYFGQDTSCETLLKVYERHNADFEKMYLAGSRSKSTLDKYKHVYNLLKDFIKYRYNRSDIALREMQPAFITDFEFYLRTEKGCTNNTVWIYQMPLRRMITIAVNNGWLPRDPFFDYNIVPEETDRECLTKDELKLMMEHKFTPRRGRGIRGDNRELIRDMFIFCVFSGFSYTDLESMTVDNLQESFDEQHRWLVKRRDKTNITSVVPLLEIPGMILEKYQGMAEGNKLLPMPKYATARTAIKRVAKECGIEKDVHWHAGRHTFATEICLTNGMPIESLSKMMGHKNISTTQIYAKITHPKLSTDATLLAQRLKGIEQFAVANI